MVSRADALKAIGGAILARSRVMDSPRLIQSRGEQGIFNVRDYGARGDGATDDLVAIVAANEAASAAKGCVFFPAGVYALSNYIDVSKEMRWYGVGSGSVLRATGKGKGIVRYRPGTPGVIQQVSGERNLIAENLFFTGTSQSGHLVHIARIVHARFTNCIFNNSKGTGLRDDNTTVVGACGVYMYAVEIASFINCDFENETANAGIGFEASNHVVTITGCHFNNCKYGVRYLGRDNGVHNVTGTMFYGGGTAFLSDVGDVYNLVIEACWAEAQTNPITFMDFSGARRNFNHVVTSNNIRGGNDKIAIHDVNVENARFSENQFNSFAYAFKNTGKGVIYGPNDYALVTTVFAGAAALNGAAQVL
jgi:pectate lyase-like protein